MSKNKIREIDERIASLTTSLTKIEGELQGLRFARDLLAQAEGESAAPLALPPSGLGAAASYDAKPSVRSLIGKVLSGSGKPLTYSQVRSEVERLTGGKVNKKTVSSSLNAMKEKNLVIHENGAYRAPHAMN